MNEDRWRRIEELYHAARLLKDSARAPFLAAATEGDDALRHEVESLLASGASSPGFLDEPLHMNGAGPRGSDAASLSGRRIGTYSVHERIGAGGMGEVYRAHDSKLRRDVAFKVLAADLIGETDPQRQDHLRRFRHEAHALAALNHPNIAAIYGLEESDGVTALVMELVEGSTLADRITQGAIPVDEALPIATQIAEALEAAHERGIVHRDLKPANIKLRPDGTVKVLDFGLAKAVGPAARMPDVSQRATTTVPAKTATGVIVGTAAYMSPEQASGKAVDHRTDIWAFGCVLFEMLTGRAGFGGDTLTDTLAAVMRAEPDWSQLPTNTPAQVRVLLRRCLQKDPRRRLQAIGDARISIEDVFSGADDSPLAAPPPAKRWQLWVTLGLASLFALGMVSFALLYLRQKPPARAALRFEIPLPATATANGGFALSPDGAKLAFIAKGADGQSRLWVRSLDTLVPRQLDGTEGASGGPFWSPDSGFIGFLAQGKLQKIAATGGTPSTLCKAAQVYGGAWNLNDQIVFASDAGILQVAASGGSPSPIDTKGGASGPSFLPDGRHFVYFRWGGRDVGIYLGSLDATPQEPPVRLLADLSNPVYVPSPDPAVGHLLFKRGSTAGIRSLGTLMVQRVDTRRLQLTGEAVQIAEQVWNFSASATGLLVYVNGRPSGDVIQGQLTWLDRKGNLIATVGEPGLYGSLALSPDGKRVAVDRVDPQGSGERSIWLYEFARGATWPFTFASVVDRNPVWSPDSRRIAYESIKGEAASALSNGLFQKNSNLEGEEHLLWSPAGDRDVTPSDWSPDGRFLLCYRTVPPYGLALLPIGETGLVSRPILLERTEFRPQSGRFSPDGRWIAYSSDDSRRDEIYLRPFEASAAVAASSTGSTRGTGKEIVSKDGGTSPLWRGTELFYLGSDRNVMVVEVNTSGELHVGVPRVLFKAPFDVLSWDVSSDGKRFLMVAPSTQSAPQPFNVVQNWQAALTK
jgi:serine/threonine protein kinase/Tol biopolymer transport system component